MNLKELHEYSIMYNRLINIDRSPKFQGEVIIWIGPRFSLRNEY